MNEHAAVDFESTFFPKKKIGLHTMGVDQYLWHPEVEIYLVSVRTREGSFVGDPREFDWEQIAHLDWVSHNAAFDRRVFRRLAHDHPEIMAHHPRVWQCTANLSVWLGYPRDLKGATLAMFNVDLDKDARKKMENKTWPQMQAEGTANEVLEYAERDALWCWKIWDSYASRWPTIEQKISEMTTQQVMRGLPCDRDYIDDSIKNLERACWDAKRHLPWTSGDDPASVLSPIAVAEECRKIGIIPPVSLAEDSSECQAWEDEHPEIPWVREMRRYRKANLLMTKFITMRSQIRPFDGRIDFGQKYCGAHTKRASGGASGGKSFNVQGFQREPFACHDLSDPDVKPIFADMRRAISAMNGGVLGIADLAQIEPRTLAWMTEDHRKLELIERGISVYQIHAVQTMGFTGKDLKKEDPHMYALAKMRVLGLSYGCGWKRFIDYCRNLYGHIITAQESRRQVADFRNKERLIRTFWNKLGNAMERSVGEDFEIELPSWNTMRYTNLRREGRNFLATLSTGRVNRLWGSLLAENCLSGESIVITPDGKRRLVDLGTDELVWDGVEFVSHFGVSRLGIKETHDFGGVFMTPDHRVLTAHGWVENQYTNPVDAINFYETQRETRHGGHAVWKSHGDGSPWKRWKASVVELSLQMRQPCEKARKGASVKSCNVIEIQVRASRRRAVHETRTEEVFDIINCGPRHRFVVENARGQRFIVHNCIQATARDCFYEKAVKIEEAGIPTLLLVHDEVVTDEIHPSQAREADEMVGEIMASPCEWMPGVALGSEHYTSPFYKK